jgi:phosphoserine aminotransferase
MTVAERTEYVTRDTIMKLLSDEEIAKVSNAETAYALVEESEYLDLEHLDKGVQRAQSGMQVSIGNALPRTAVSQDTWDKLLAQLSV